MSKNRKGLTAPKNFKAGRNTPREPTQYRYAPRGRVIYEVPEWKLRQEAAALAVAAEEAKEHTRILKLQAEQAKLDLQNLRSEDKWQWRESKKRGWPIAKEYMKEQERRREGGKRKRLSFTARERIEEWALQNQLRELQRELHEARLAAEAGLI